MKDFTETMPFNSEVMKRENIRHLLELTKDALNERGYNAVNQIAGYLVSNDPAYISSHKNARSIIQSVDQYEIIEELVRFYLDNQ
ncbi:MAG: IreB family regulatory phosphoprotein [Erysipelotrichaceae bacterium]